MPKKLTLRKILGVSLQQTRILRNRYRKSEYRSWISSNYRTSRGSQIPQHVSVLMATYNTPVEFLKIAIESVRNQTCPNWELSIVDDSSSSIETRSYLDSISKTDSRIKVNLKSENSGISETLNIAIAQSNGEFLGVLDHDDALHPRAIELCLEAVKNNTGAILIYSDEDKIDKKGIHSNPFFKPDYSPELLLSQMYLNHFTIMKSSEVKAIGGFRKEFDGAQDHDLALRLPLSKENVVHIKQVLYHWRAWEESTAMSIDAKPWAQTAAQRVQIEYMKSTGLGGTSVPSSIKGLNSIHWNILGKPKVGVIIPTASRRDPDSGGKQRLVDKCLDSLRSATGVSDIDICIVHTGSLESDQEFVYQNSGYKLVPYDKETFNFSHAVNLGVEALDAEFVLLLNDDTRIINPKSIDYMVEYAQQKQVGVVGAKLTFPNKRIQHAGMVSIGDLPTHPYYNASESEYGYYGSLLTPRNYLSVTAAAAMVRKEVFEEVSGFDEEFAHDFNDVDFCYRIHQAGYRNVWTPFAHFEHVEGASIVRTRANPLESELFLNRYQGKFEPDPYYSPRLKQDIRRLYEFQ